MNSNKETGRGSKSVYVGGIIEGKRREGGRKKEEK